MVVNTLVVISDEASCNVRIIKLSELSKCECVPLDVAHQTLTSFEDAVARSTVPAFFAAYTYRGEYGEESRWACNVLRGCAG